MSKEQTMSRRDFLKYTGTAATLLTGAVVLGPKRVFAGSSEQISQKDEEKSTKLNVQVDKPELWPQEESNVIGQIDLEEHFDNEHYSNPRVTFIMTNKESKNILIYNPSAVGTNPSTPFRPGVYLPETNEPITGPYSWKPGEQLKFTISFDVRPWVDKIADGELPIWDIDFTFFTRKNGQGAEIAHIQEQIPTWFVIEKEEPSSGRSK